MCRRAFTLAKHLDSGVPIHDMAFTPPPAEPQASAARRPQPPDPAGPATPPDGHPGNPGGPHTPVRQCHGHPGPDHRYPDDHGRHRQQQDHDRAQPHRGRHPRHRQRCREPARRHHGQHENLYRFRGELDHLDQHHHAERRDPARGAPVQPNHSITIIGGAPLSTLPGNLTITGGTANDTIRSAISPPTARS